MKKIEILGRTIGGLAVQITDKSGETDFVYKLVLSDVELLGWVRAIFPTNEISVSLVKSARRMKGR